jgi:hypothetical protein
MHAHDHTRSSSPAKPRSARQDARTAPLQPSTSGHDSGHHRGEPRPRPSSSPPVASSTRSTRDSRGDSLSDRIADCRRGGRYRSRPDDGLRVVRPLSESDRGAVHTLVDRRDVRQPERRDVPRGRDVRLQPPSAPAYSQSPAPALAPGAATLAYAGFTRQPRPAAPKVRLNSFISAQLVFPTPFSWASFPLLRV